MKITTIIPNITLRTKMNQDDQNIHVIYECPLTHSKLVYKTPIFENLSPEMKIKFDLLQKLCKEENFKNFA